MTCATGQISIQAKIWKGYAKAALKLGAEYQFSRPTANGGAVALEGGGDVALEDSSGVLALEAGGWQYPGTQLFTRHVSLNAEDMKYSRPNKYGKPTWYAVMDGKDLKAGDYFVGPQGTFFIAALQPLLPILVIECNRSVSVFRPQSQTGVGQQGYGGTTAVNETLVVQGAPCSILQGTKGEKSETTLPGDTRSPWWTILIPSSVCRLVADDIMVDDFGQRYVISSAELTDLGYRCTAMTAIT